MNAEDFDRAVQEHDEAVAARGLSIWVGAEPTFTDRTSIDPAWLVGALGADKEARARALLADLRDALVRAAVHPNFAASGAPADSSCRCIVMRSVGRRYPGEATPRWSYGLFCLRDGAPLWDGPRDPLESEPAAAAVAADAPAPGRRLRDALAAALTASRWTVCAVEVEGALPHRLAFRTDGQPVPEDPRFARSSFHAPPAQEAAPVDALAAEGTFLVSIGEHPDDPGVPRVELPALGNVSLFVALLQDLALAAQRAGLPALVLAGYPPPVNPSAAWTTVTPDPGVIEVNMAPAPDVSTFLKWSRELHAAAARHGLAPLRWWFNGDVADSGGGGHLTLGGPTPEQSPFFLRPRLLPALIAYLNHHPSLSYLFAVDSLGGSSQSPRPDEGVRESFEELSLALSLLSRLPEPAPEQLWAGLAPFLADRFGNVHRSEVNVEKLWNPYNPGRGRWGVVELRALRMAPTPERAAALAALFRGLAAMLAGATEVPALTDWGATLHDRYALPFFLERDLEGVLADLDTAGLGLPDPLAAELRDDDHRVVGRAELGEVQLTVRRAIEFWPLVGDLTEQEARTARLIDSSTVRLELLVRAIPGAAPDTLARWRVAVGDVLVPLSWEQDAHGPALVMGLRLRAFVPTPGLHPTLKKQLPLELIAFPQGATDGLRVTLHDWRPGGGTYTGLPGDQDEAASRREERFVVQLVSLAGRAFRAAPAEALTPLALDLRRLNVIPSLRK